MRRRFQLLPTGITSFYLRTISRKESLLLRNSFHRITRIILLALVCKASVAQHALQMRGEIQGVHDPSIAEQSEHYYLFSTGRAPDGGQLAIRCSDNLTNWKLCGHVFASLPPWIHAASPETKDLWAPDISFFHGRYHLYYVWSTFGSNNSGIALATNTTLDPASPDYRWQDEGPVLQSRRGDDFNAIDPNISADTSGRLWISYGSLWSGIKLQQIDAVTGKLLPRGRTYSLASRPQPPHAVEAPFIVHHGSYYYLFVAFDLCCRGTKSTYRTVVGRSREITGPYLDKTGKPMLQGGGSELLTATRNWIGPGGASILQKPDQDLIVFHAYSAGTGTPTLQISTLQWEDDWPYAALQ